MSAKAGKTNLTAQSSEIKPVAKPAPASASTMKKSTAGMGDGYRSKRYPKATNSQPPSASKMKKEAAKCGKPAMKDVPVAVKKGQKKTKVLEAVDMITMSNSAAPIAPSVLIDLTQEGDEPAASPDLALATVLR